MALKYRDAFLALAAADWEPLVQFYSQLFGQPPEPYIPGVYAEFGLQSLRLGIFKPKAGHELEFQASSRSSLSVCLEVEDLESAIAHLVSLGYPPPGSIMTASHGREIYAYDPAGNRFILHEGVNPG